MSFKLDTGYFCKKRKAMNDNGKINRRDFIKSSVLTGGVLFAQAAIPARAMDFLSEKNRTGSDTCPCHGFSFGEKQE